MTLDVLKEVFSYGYVFGERFLEDILVLEASLANGAIILSIENIPVVPPERWNNRGVLKRRVDRKDRLPVGLFSGGAPHKDICARAAVWIERRGLDWDDRDLHYPGGIADVASTDRSIVVEVGFTQAAKIVRALQSEERLVSVLVVPYSNEVVSVETGELIGYFFQRKKEENDGST